MIRFFENLVVGAMLAILIGGLMWMVFLVASFFLVAM